MRMQTMGLRRGRADLGEAAIVTEADGSPLGMDMSDGPKRGRDSVEMVTDEARESGAVVLFSQPQAGGVMRGIQRSLGIRFPVTLL